MSQPSIQDTLGAGAASAEEVELTANEKQMNLYNEEGVKLANNDDHEAALNNYTRAIKDSAEDSVLMPIFLSNRAHSLISLDKLDEAIADCTRAAKCDPKCVMAYVAHSKVYAYKGKLGQALDLLRQALSKDKENKGVQAKIQQIEAEQKLETVVPKNDVNRQKMNQYLDHLKGQGVQASKTKIRMIDQRTTVVLATKDIAKDEEVMFIPADLMLELESAGDVPANSWLLWNTKVGEKLINKEQNTIAMYYLHEKNNKKWKFKKYFDSLLQDNTNHVIRWEEADREVLKASWLHPHIEKRQQQVKEDYDLIQKEVPVETRGEFTLDQYKQAWAWADSQFMAMQKGSYVTQAMVPLLNYFTHNDPSSTTIIFNSEKNGVQIIAARKIQRGEEVCLKPSQLDNAYFLMSKGVVQRRSPTRVPFNLQLSKEDPMYQAKKNAMGGKIDSKLRQIYPNLNDPQLMDTIMFLRYYLMTGSPETFQKMRNQEVQRKMANKIQFNAENAFLGSPVSPASSNQEIQVWASLASMIKSRMQTYPLGIDVVKKAVEAHHTPEGPHLSPSQEVAHVYLLSEQESLIGIYQLAQIFTELLSKDFDALIKELNEKPYYRQWEGYIQSSILQNKKMEYDLAKSLAAAKAGAAGGEGGEAVKQLPAGADAGAGSLY